MLYNPLFSFAWLVPVQFTILPHNLTVNETNLVVLYCNAWTFLHIIRQKTDKICLSQSNWTFKEVRGVILVCTCVLQAMEWDKRRQQISLLRSGSRHAVLLLHLSCKMLQLYNYLFLKQLLLFSAQTCQNHPCYLPIWALSFFSILHHTIKYMI